MSRSGADVTATVTATELAILDVLWKRGPTTVREIVEEIYGEHRPSLHSAVKSLIDRLSDKGFVACEKKAFAHLFVATVDRDRFVGQQLQQLADSHYRGALSPMVLSLVERMKLSEKDRAAIRKIIDGIE
jgi:BlaI family penicillinase repressor